MKISFTFEPKPAVQQNLRQQFPNHEFRFGKGTAPESDTAVWVTYGEDVKEDAIEKLSDLQWVSVASAGVEKMPLNLLHDKEILVTNSRGIHKTPMTESIVGHILSLYRNLPAIYTLTNEQKWEKPKGSKELRGSNALIVGPGAIGEEVGRVLTALGVGVIGCNRSGKAIEGFASTVSLEQLDQQLASADIVISLLPSTPETHHLFTKEQFHKMKDTALFMNFGRGNVVSEQVLVEALKAGEIGGAVLDVFEVEPLPESSELWGLPNVVISPHVSSHSDFYVERAMEIFSRNLSKWEQGETDLENQVDLKLGY